MERQIFLFFHFMGMGLFVTVQTAGLILEMQYRKAPTLEAKAVLLRALKPVGLLSPLAVVITLVTGIGNMVELGLGVFSLGWLTAKIIFFAIAVISGLLFSVKARRRGALVRTMVKGEAPATADGLIRDFDRQVGLFYLVSVLLLIVIVGLAVYGRTGGQ
jgi:uncharacterized membrane protein SirB2